MRITTKVTGVQGVLAELDKVTTNMQRGAERGVKKAGVFLQRKSMLIVPVDTGALRASAFVRKHGSGLETVVFVGYTTDYVVYVHEDLDKAHGSAFNAKYADEIADPKNKMKARGENQQAKFLEQPQRQYRRKIRRIIAKEMLL